MTLMSNPKGSVATIIVAADGTGDTTDIQTGINLLPATGGCVYIKEGTYLITAQITIPNNNIAITGCGRSTIIQTNNAITMISATSRLGILVEKLYFYGSALIGNNGISFNLVDDSMINECWIENCGRNGINYTSCNNSTVINNRITTCQTGMLFGGGTTNIIMANRVTSCSVHGIRLDPETNEMIIVGNVSSTNVRDGISLVTCSNSLIVNNECNGNDSDDTATFDGIFISENSNNNIIADNRLRDNDRYEVNVATADCNNNLVHGNICLGDDHVGTINDVGTNTQIFNNIET